MVCILLDPEKSKLGNNRTRDKILAYRKKKEQPTKIKNQILRKPD